MGISTDYLGHFDIDPPLNDSEQQYLAAFSASRRFVRPGGPYAVPGNPSAENESPPVNLDRYSEVAPGQPGLWCGWVPCWDGCCLAHDGLEKFNNPIPWLTYLIDHFLAPHAYASTAGMDEFANFTFDHVVDGVVAACNRDSRELYLVRAETNLVRRETVVAPRWEYDMPGLLDYEAVKDESAPRRTRKRSAG